MARSTTKCFGFFFFLYVCAAVVFCDSASLLCVFNTWKQLTTFVCSIGSKFQRFSSVSEYDNNDSQNSFWFFTLTDIVGHFLHLTIAVFFLAYVLYMKVVIGFNLLIITILSKFSYLTNILLSSFLDQVNCAKNFTTLITKVRCPFWTFASFIRFCLFVCVCFSNFFLHLI